MTAINFKSQIYKKENCVLCNSKNLSLAINLKSTPLANSYSTKNKKVINFPLKVYYCIDCGHLQLKYLVNPKLMFSNYLYVSGTSKVLRKHFHNYAKNILNKFSINKNKDKILDIACNDGTFLNQFKNQGCKKLYGIEPAKNLTKGLQKFKIDNIFFDFDTSLKIKKKFKIITANNVLAHIPSIRSFVMGVKNILEDDGIFIFEVSYLMDVIEKKTFDTIYHEHMSYHAVTPLISFFKSCGLEIFDLDKVEAQGGSIRLFVGNVGKFKIKNFKINKILKSEKKLFNILFYKNYFKKLLFHKKKLKSILKKIKREKKIIYAYGAPAKLTTFSYFFELDKNIISKVIDDNPLKQGLFTPGKKIEIISYNKLKLSNFDYILISAWNFSDSIIENLKRDFKNKIIILPFPKIKFIKI
jgi:SAM-dependent methyltransferase